MACDICGNNKGPLVDLLSGYQTEAIKQICHDCEKTTNAQVWKIRSYQDGFMKTLVKRWMENKRSQCATLENTMANDLEMRAALDTLERLMAKALPEDAPYQPSIAHALSASRAALSRPKATGGEQAVSDAVSIPRSLAIRTWGFIAQDCTPCMSAECQIDGKNANVDVLEDEWSKVVDGLRARSASRKGA